MVGSRREDQALLLETLWFRIFSRGGGKFGSSGFEHVFLQEINKGENKSSYFQNIE